MQHRDILKDEIERVGKAIAQVVANFLNRKAHGGGPPDMEVADRELQAQLDLNVNDLFGMDTESLHAFLLDKNFTSEHSELLASYLRESAEMEAAGEMSQPRLQLALRLLETADALAGAVSFERMTLMDQIKEKLDGLDA
ncbi:MAG: hypothetical protein HQ500_02870 [Flavobacteriales bacterium]|nr:hypothetical protein [Flavobacteriales bacterium]